MIRHPFKKNSTKEEPQNCINYCSNMHEIIRRNNKESSILSSIFHIREKTFYEKDVGLLMALKKNENKGDLELTLSQKNNNKTLGRAQDPRANGA